MGDQLLGDCNCQTELFSLGFPYRLNTYQPPLSATLQENNNNKSPVLDVQLVDGNAQHSVHRISVVALHMLVHSEHVQTAVQLQLKLSEFFCHVRLLVVTKICEAAGKITKRTLCKDSKNLVQPNPPIY